MFSFFIQGLLLGLAYVAPIGACNINVINSAIRQPLKIALRTTISTIFFDISLAIACFLGVGYILDQYSTVKLIVLAIGGLLVTYIGIKLIVGKIETHKNTPVQDTWGRVILTTFSVLWLNPQAIIDGSMLLGGMRSTMQADQAIYFIIGVCTASIVWTIALTLIVSRFKKAITPKILKIINIVCGVIIIFFGIKLLYNFMLQII